MNCCIDANAIVAPVLMRFSFGCGQVLRVFEDISAEMTAQAELEAAAAAAAESNKNNEEKHGTEVETDSQPKPTSLETNNIPKTTIKTEENSSANCTESSDANCTNQTNQLNSKTVINNSQQANYSKVKATNDDQLNDQVKRVEQLDNEETRQSSSDISGYHSDENTDYRTDYLLNGSIQSGQQNSGILILILKKCLKNALNYR